MEFINYTRHDTTANTTIDGLKTKFRLQGKKKFSGIGSYLEVEVLKKGQDSIIRIPFFNTYKRKLVNTNGLNKLNKKAVKVVRKVVKDNCASFDLETFVNNKIAEIDNKISTLNTTVNDIKKAHELETYRNHVLKGAKRKDTERIIKNEIKELKEFINKGLILKTKELDEEKIAKIKNYLDKYETLETLKVQKKQLTFKDKRGLSKLNNKVVKTISSIGLAGILGFGVIHHTGFLSGSKNKDDNSNNSLETKNTVPLVTKEPKATNEPLVTKEPKATNEPIITKEPKVRAELTSKYSLDSEAISLAYSFNLDAFNSLKPTIQSREYGYSFEQMTYGYTFIEHASEIDTRNLSMNEIKEYITAGRCLICILVEKGLYNQIPLQGNTYNVIQNCLNGNYKTGIEFVQNSNENNTPLLDMLVVGETEGYLLYEDALYDFNTNVYYKEINTYYNDLNKSELPKEVIKVLKLNI